ncbi:hypothetical protein [Paenibacillus taichungensis]|uniref:hypothetical protein n=1 Tax=Paenibacillus taichungensis TaxID=484184 RepID=UPI002871CB9C|nr:hypothetical protein [Paenibacillus taichungensis]MDR9748596.1 hypothetical protein [Paenibacillus taichungensis]
MIGMYFGYGGILSALVSFLILSVMFLPAVHNTLLTMILLLVLVQILLFASAWLMWESLLSPNVFVNNANNIEPN